MAVRAAHAEAELIDTRVLARARAAAGRAGQSL